MWQRTAVWLICFQATLALQAEETPSLLVMADFPATLLAQENRLRFEIVSGRISIRSVHVGTKTNVCVKRSEGGLAEQLQFILGDTSMSLRYCARFGPSKFSVEAARGDQIVVQWETLDASDPVFVAYSQCRSCVQLTIRRSDSEQRYQHPTLWHLLFEQPEVGRTCVLPLLSHCRASWDLERQWADVRSALCDQVGSVSLPAQDELLSWVRQLSSPERRERRIALRRLHQVGQPLIAFLDSLDPQQLDREQRVQLAKLRSLLDRPALDTPTLVATRLAADPRIWRALAFDADASVRTAAGRQLKMLTGRASATDGFASSK